MPSPGLEEVLRISLVFVEKTPCHTIEQAEELAELQRKTGRGMPGS